jgi:hypothetical protein
MPITPTYPGVYIQEAPSSSHTVIAAPTNIAVFIGYTHPLKTDQSLFNKATEIFGFMDYQRQFGGFVRSAAFAQQAYDLGDADNNVGDRPAPTSRRPDRSRVPRSRSAASVSCSRKSPIRSTA